MSNPQKSLVWLLFALAGVAGLVWLCLGVVYPFYLQITDQAGPFYLTPQAVDVDGDGDLDVLVHNMRKPELFEAYAGGSLWINQGDGRFIYRLSDLEGGWASTSADLNGDGIPDILVYEGNFLSIGLNQGGQGDGQTAIFKRTTSIIQPVSPVEEYGVLVTADVDGDGRVDALMLGRAHSFRSDESPLPPNFSWMWLNKIQADGRLATDTVILPALDGVSVAAAAAGDVDQDGDPDLMVVVSPSEKNSMSGSTGLVLINDGAGHFSDAGLRLDAEGAVSIALGDVDSDGDLDALVGFAHGAALWINQGRSAEQFSAAPRFPGGSKTRNALLADLDGDGDLDALVVGKKQAVIWLNDGQGQFTRSGQNIPCAKNQDLTVGDFNQDGRVDIFVAEYDKIAQVWWNDGQGKFVAGGRQGVFTLR